MKLAVALVVVVAGCISPVMHFGGGKTAKQAQHDNLAERTPGRLSFDKRWTGPVADAVIRVYADDDFRAQNQQWKKAFDDRLDYVNAVLGPGFGVHLVPEYKEWSHHAPGETLAEQIVELQKLDDGAGVLTVVGLTSALSLASATFDQIGYASIGGRHMVIRGYADVQERAAYQAAFRDLASDELENALQMMRGHKNASVFLHELGHNLGATHEETPDTLMNAGYSQKATGFSPQAMATIQQTLDRRLGRAHAAEVKHVASHGDGNAHGEMRVVVVAGGAVVDGVSHEDDDLDLLFGSQAKIDPDVDVVVSKGDGGTSEAVAKIVDRLRKLGLKNVRFQ